MRKVRLLASEIHIHFAGTSNIQFQISTERQIKISLKNPDNSYDILLYFPEVPADEYMDFEYIPPAWGIINLKLPDYNTGSLTKTDYTYSEHPVINYLYHTDSYTECLNICEQLWQ